MFKIVVVMSVLMAVLADPVDQMMEESNEEGLNIQADESPKPVLPKDEMTKAILQALLRQIENGESQGPVQNQYVPIRQRPAYSFAPRPVYKSPYPAAYSPNPAAYSPYPAAYSPYPSGYAQPSPYMAGPYSSSFYQRYNPAMSYYAPQVSPYAYRPYYVNRSPYAAYGSQPVYVPSVVRRPFVDNREDQEAMAYLSALKAQQQKKEQPQVDVYSSLRNQDSESQLYEQLIQLRQYLSQYAAPAAKTVVVTQYVPVSRAV